ncbi:MAG TPA: ribonucleotide-diphosphate reductase subunit beta [Candidatus Dormibacteraeota bacterium]|nr:ribonucleotide-diphosphate reductase subunit beta [Candidatus Dormibacteraeota bacterium]
MTIDSGLDAVRRVEDAPLSELVAVSVDDVEAQMDSLLQPAIDSAALYRRWERQQWAVSDLDFTKDTSDWQRLPSAIRNVMQHTMTLFFIGEQAVTDTLAPLLHAADREDERIFLATQIADEARHTVFFQRFFDEVLGVGGGLHSALDAISPRATEGFRKIFEHQLRDAMDLVRREPQNERAWVEGVVTYHLIIEGYLAVTGQRSLLRTLRRVGLMPGFTAGFTAVARDESRHIGFGVMALRRRVRERQETARLIALKVLELLPPAVHTVVAPDRRLPIEDPREVPEALRVDGDELRQFAVASLGKRLRAAGLSAGAVEGISVEANALYDRAWSEYERTHQLRHPVRYYQEGLVTAPL